MSKKKSKEQEGIQSCSMRLRSLEKKNGIKFCLSLLLVFGGTLNSIKKKAPPKNPPQIILYRIFVK